jgi:hypothetical protein
VLAITMLAVTISANQELLHVDRREAGRCAGPETVRATTAAVEGARVAFEATSLSRRQNRKAKSLLPRNMPTTTELRKPKFNVA